MLSEPTAGYLSGLVYRDDATREINIIPWGVIYWEDEMPNFSYVRDISDDDSRQISQMFRIRERIWQSDALPEADQKLWDTINSQVPAWAFFRRLTISEDDQSAREIAAQIGAELDEMEDELEQEMLRDGAHQIVTIDEHGNKSVLTTLDTAEEQPAGERRRPWRLRSFLRKWWADR